MMKNHSKKKPECDYSFEMLYQATFGKAMSVDQKEKFKDLPQEEINELVLKWSKQARWHTQKRTGTDGVEYCAFWK